MDKAELRLQMAVLGPVGPAENADVVAGLFSFLSSRLPGTITAYLAMPTEVDLSPLFETLPGWRWVLPRVEPDRSLTFRDIHARRERHEYGMEQPADAGPEIPVAEIDTFLVPGLAFDEEGGRLGRGGGFYDRLLGVRRHDAPAVGITTQARLVAEVPMSGHDQRVDWLATETGIRRCSPRI